MRFMKVFIIIFILINCVFLSANEKNIQGEEKDIAFNNAIARNMESFNKAYDDFINNDIMFYAAKKPVKKTQVKAKKTLTNKQKAGVAVNVIGVFCLAAGIGLLAGSLVYADNVEKNETEDFDKYKTGKNTARGLFYGSIGGLGTGAVCVTVSIPLFVEAKNKAPIKKKK